MFYKIWVDDIRHPLNTDWLWCKTVNQAKNLVEILENTKEEIVLIFVDHDAGDFAVDGGDYIKLLDYLERVMISIPIRIHSMNPVGRENMRAIIRRNGWKEIL